MLKQDIDINSRSLDLESQEKGLETVYRFYDSVYLLNGAGGPTQLLRFAAFVHLPFPIDIGLPTYFASHLFSKGTVIRQTHIM